MAYKKSGSSFAGGIFHADPNAVYWFEPIGMAYVEMYGVIVPPWSIRMYPNGTARNIPYYERAVVTDMLRNLFTCNYKDITPYAFLGATNTSTFSVIDDDEYNQCMMNLNLTWQHQFALLPTDIALNTSDCNRVKAVINTVQPMCLNPIIAAKYKLNISDNNIDELNRYKEIQHILPRYFTPISKCIESHQRSCQRTPIRATKVLRTELRSLIETSHNDPDLRIIFYMRDPRGIQNSRRKRGRNPGKSNRCCGDFYSFGSDDIISSSKVLCNMIKVDLDYLESLNKTQMSKIIVVKYEDLILHTELELKRIYRFLGRTEVPTEVVQWLDEHMHCNSTIPHLLCNENSEKVVYSWRNDLPDAVIESITEDCKDVLLTLNYPTY
ncbi:unnamed protein product [Owenia fusiformis]|nr:unnamed protein product [Owenia fusiformis]